MLAHELEAVAHQHDGIERGAAALRPGGRMRGDAVELEARAVDRQHAAVEDVVLVAGVPVQDHVDVAEQAGADHVDLAVAALLGRRAVIAQRAGDAIALHVLLERDRRERGPGAEQVVATGMAGPVGDDRAAVRRRRLRQPGQRIELAHDADHRLALAEGRDEPGRLAGDARLDAEARGGKLALQQRRAVLFVVAELGTVPDRLGGRREMRGALVDELENVLVPRRLGDGGAAGAAAPATRRRGSGGR